MATEKVKKTCERVGHVRSDRATRRRGRVLGRAWGAMRAAVYLLVGEGERARERVEVSADRLVMAGGGRGAGAYRARAGAVSRRR